MVCRHIDFGHLLVRECERIVERTTLILSRNVICSWLCECFCSLVARSSATPCNVRKFVGVEIYLIRIAFAYLNGFVGDEFVLRSNNCNFIGESTAIYVCRNGISTGFGYSERTLVECSIVVPNYVGCISDRKGFG